MTIQDLGALGELLGSVAVLVTLVYLAFQTRQNTLAIGAQLDSARVSSSLNLILTIATSSEVQDALAEDRTYATTINADRRRGIWFAEFFMYSWQLRQARRGLMPSFNEAAVSRRLGSFFGDYRSFDAWWEDAKLSFFPEFVELVEEQRRSATRETEAG